MNACGLAVLVILLIGILSLTLYCAKAQEPEFVTLYIINPLTGNSSFNVYDYPVNSVFTAEFYLGNITNLVAWQMHLAYNRTLIQYANAWFPEDNVFEKAIERGATPLSEVSNNVNNSTEVGDLMIVMTSSYPPDISSQYPVNVTSKGLLCEVNFTIESHAADTQLYFISTPPLIAPLYFLPNYSTCVETINGTYTARGDRALIHEINNEIPESATLMFALIGPAATSTLILTMRKRARAQRYYSNPKRKS